MFSTKRVSSLISNIQAYKFLDYHYDQKFEKTHVKTSFSIKEIVRNEGFCLSGNPSYFSKTCSLFIKAINSISVNTLARPHVVHYVIVYSIESWWCLDKKWVKKEREWHPSFLPRTAYVKMTWALMLRRKLSIESLSSCFLSCPHQILPYIEYSGLLDL